MPNTHDVIISGAGMVGLSLSLAAAKFGLSVALIEKQRENKPAVQPGVFTPRVSAINHASERLLTRLGAWTNIPKSRLSPYSQMHVWDQLGQGRVDFDANDVQRQHLGHIIENRWITDALWQEVDNHPDIEVLLNDEINAYEQDDQSVEVMTHSGIKLSAQVLVGSEGKHSPVRKQSAIDTVEWPYDHTAVVTTVRHHKPHGKAARQVFLETGPLAFLPLQSEESDEHYSSIVWSAKTEFGQELMTYSDEEFIKKLDRAFEHTLGQIEQVDPRFAFGLYAQQAKEYVDGRVCIIGDAAHTIHPLAGLGVNLGFLDAAALAETCHSARSKEIDLGHSFVLRRFQRQRQSHNYAVAALMEGLKRLFGSQAPGPVVLRNLGLSAVNSSNLIKRPLIQGALGDIGTPLPNLCKPLAE